MTSSIVVHELYH